jgi:hypothetical protein
VSLKFFIDIILPDDSASNRNKYQEYFLGLKEAGAYGRQPYHLNVPIFMKSRSLKFLESSGSVQAFNETALPSTFNKM